MIDWSRNGNSESLGEEKESENARVLCGHKFLETIAPDADKKLL
jgi:hypothetical protein